MNKKSSLESLCHVMTSMVPEIRALFNFVEALMILLLMNPATSATAERSCSSLRRLKTYLRLNNIAICHVHEDALDKLNVNELMNVFIMSKEIHAAVFGGHLD